MVFHNPIDYDNWSCTLGSRDIDCWVSVMLSLGLGGDLLGSFKFTEI